MAAWRYDQNELDGINSLPLNQLAKELLRQAGQAPNPRMVHCVQLASWGMEEGLGIPCDGERFRPELQEVLDRLAQTRPDGAVLLLCPLPDEPPLNLADVAEEAKQAEANLQDQSPEEAAMELVENLYYNLVRTDDTLRLHPRPESD